MSLATGIGSTKLRRWAATALLLLITAVAVALIWDAYVVAPWTRDGRVRVLVANVAPQVSGQIVELRIRDNQRVRKGDVLYVIDPFDFKVKLQSAQAQVKSQAANLQVKQVESQRRQALTNLAATVEEKQQYAGSATAAEASLSDAQAQAAQADINLKRTQVLSPVDGYVTNLQLRAGDYANTGSSNVSVIDEHSFWIDGYFEETKLEAICVGDAVSADLMGFRRPLVGHVESFGRGISVSDAANSTQGLPDVDAVYTWVRLAQRVPVRIALDHVPPGIPLASGLTATVRVQVPGSGAASGAWPWLQAHGHRVLAFYHLAETTPRACREPDDAQGGSVTTVPTDNEPKPLAPDAVNPGLAPSMTTPPKQ